MYNRRYEKVFLMLRQETAGYALGKRPPWGSCVMELKNGRGKLHLTIQGLQPLRYEVYVLAAEESIFCGEVIPEKREGRGELQWEFDPDAVGKGKKAEAFHTVLLAAGESVALAAYFQEKRDWKKVFTPREKTEEAIALQAAEAAALERPSPILEKPAEEKSRTAQIAEEQKESFHGSFQGLLAKFRQELEELEETGVLCAEETAQIRQMGAAEPEENEAEPTEHTEQIDQPSLFASRRVLSPFAEGEDWNCLSLEDLTLLSQIPLKWQREFFFLLPYRKYHHLILREAAEGIWLGLPAYYDEADAADAHTFGFDTFRKVDGDWGYWMCFLERNS